LQLITRIRTYPANVATLFTFSLTCEFTNCPESRMEKYGGGGNVVRLSNYSPRLQPRYNWGGNLGINPLNVMTTYTYNTTTHLLENVSEPLSTTKTRYTAYTRNSQGDVTQEIVRENGSSGTLIRQVDYLNFDTYGNIGEVKVKDTNRDIVTTYEYNALHHSAFMTKKSMAVKDLSNNTTTIHNNYEYDTAAGTVTKMTDGEGYQTTYEYDKLGRVTKAKNPDNSFARISYDDFNNTLTVVDEEGLTSVTKHNPLGWKTDAGIVEAGIYKAKAKSGYDENGRLLWTEDAIGNKTDYLLDNWDRQKRVTYPDTTYSEMFYDDILSKTRAKDPEDNEAIQTLDLLGRVVKQEEKKPGGTAKTLAEFTYDYFGNVLTAKDALQQTTTYTYDYLGRLNGVLNAKQELTQYTYSLAGHLLQTTYPDQTFKQKKYDEMGRVLLKKDGKANEDKYTYDKNSNVVGREDREGHTFSFNYNNRNFLTSKISNDETISFTYDLTGKRKTMTDATGTTYYEYNKSTGVLEKVIYPDTRTIQYSYDENGRRNQMKDPFDANSYYTYDAMNRLTSVSSSLGSKPEAQYGYTANGLLSDIVQKNDVTTKYSYDGLRLDTLTHRKADNTVIQSFDYDYDDNGNIESKVENGATSSFGYDELNRIETSSQFAETYAYDSKGNRTSYARNTLFENDNKDLVYDDRDRLTQVVTNGGKSVSYKYNGDNLLYKRTENGQTTRYYYDGAEVIAEADVVNGNAVLKARYIRGQGLIATEDASANKSYYLQNGHGDVIELRDETGDTRLNRYTYDMWGNPVIEEESVHNAFRYSGELWDDTTSLQYLRARWYDPSDGRFINEDTYEGQIDNPLSQNLYTYVNNNPLIYRDPTGHAKASDNLELASLVKPYGDRYKDILDLRTRLTNEMHSCSLVTLCQSLQSRVENTDWKGLLNAQERAADAMRMTYYTMNNLAIPSDVKYRDVIYPDVTDQINGLLRNLELTYSDVRDIPHLKRLGVFYTAVNTNSSLDLKTSWNLKNNAFLVYNGDIMRYDAPGNIVYGYLGKLFGFSNFELLGGGIYAQFKDGTVKNDWIFYTGGDDPVDQYYIRYGINLYNSSH